jgi:polysaccharide export outer membrane protein
MKPLNFQSIIFSYSTILILFICSILFASVNLLGQISESEFKEVMEGYGNKGTKKPESDATGYKSFVQNEFQNIFTKISDLEEQDIQEITFAEINNKRIELAMELCNKDQRACFLIDEYRSYKSSQDDTKKNFEDLKLFGQDIFSGYSNEFNFYDSLSLDDTYVIKLKDQFKISLFGGFSFDDTVEVQNNGSIIIPDIGEYQVAGFSFGDISVMIKDDIAQKFPGTEAYISLASIRSKQIFALGNVRTPGTYALNSFGTALNALISSGGVNNNSSLRTIKVVRDNVTIQTIDLYDLLMKGITGSADFVLNDGDSILVGGLKSSISIKGEVIRPAIYEIKEGETLSDILQFALGTTPFSDLSNISVERILASGEKTILNPSNINNFIVKNGDSISVNSAEGQTINTISLYGALRNKGEYSIENKKTLGDIIDVKKDLLDNTYTGFAVLKRLNFLSKSYRLLTFSLTDQRYLDDFNIYSGDKIFIFSSQDIQYSQSQEVYDYLNSKLQFDPNNLAEGLPSYEQLSNNSSGFLDSNDPEISKISGSSPCLNSLDSLIVNPISNLIEAKLKLFPSNNSSQCTSFLNTNHELLPILLINSVPVVGNVRFPGLYPTSRELNALDLFNYAGGFLLSKLNVEPIFDVGIRARGFGSFKFDELRSLTNITMLNLKIDEDSRSVGYIELVGEFQNPGFYAISKNTTLSEIYERSGGLNSSAYPPGGVFTRISTKKVEAEALKRSKAELEQTIASAVASGRIQQNSADLIGLISLLSSMENINSVGRLVTELNPSKINDNLDLNITLEDGDKIFMPSIQTTVTVVGQVLNPVTVPHMVGGSFDDYLKLAGGLKKEADSSKIYAILPNGAAIKKSRFSLPVLPFMSLDRNDILPGSTIVIPRKARPLDSLALVETITPVLANLSVTAASIAAISDN